MERQAHHQNLTKSNLNEKVKKERETENKSQMSVRGKENKFLKFIFKK